MTGGWLAPNAWGALGAIYLVLALASLAVAVLVRRDGRAGHDELVRRVQSWWVMIGAFSVALLLSRTAAILFFALVSFLALKEYFSLIPTRRVDRRVLFWAYLAIPVQYWWVASGWYGMFVIFIPVYMFLFLPARMLLTEQPAGFLHATGSLHWGLMIAVFSVSHTAFLLVLPDAGNPVAGSAGLVLFLLVLTEGNDVLQYVTGRLAGRRRVAPAISPGKTWEGLAGGVAGTALLALVVAPLLTPFGWWQGALVGLLLAVAGFAGDLTMSAVKRDLGIKDAGALLPGHGGVLDRVDSLVFTGPLFFHVVRYFHY